MRDAHHHVLCVAQAVLVQVLLEGCNQLLFTDLILLTSEQLVSEVRCLSSSQLAAKLSYVCLLEQLASKCKVVHVVIVIVGLFMVTIGIWIVLVAVLLRGSSLSII